MTYKEAFSQMVKNFPSWFCYGGKDLWKHANKAGYEVSRVLAYSIGFMLKIALIAAFPLTIPLMPFVLIWINKKDIQREAQFRKRMKDHFARR